MKSSSQALLSNCALAAAAAGENVPDGVTGSQSDPLRNRSVLLLSFRKLLLRTEGLVALQSPSHQSRMSLEMSLAIIINLLLLPRPPLSPTHRKSRISNGKPQSLPVLEKELYIPAS